MYLSKEDPDNPATHGILDFTKPVVQDIIVQQAVAVAECGLYDGIFFDYWSDQWSVIGGWDGTRDYRPYSLEAEQEARLTVARRIRAETRPNFLIMGNTNYAILPNTREYVNGAFMETTVPAGNHPEDIEFKLGEIEKALRWFDENLRAPSNQRFRGLVDSDPAARFAGQPTMDAGVHGAKSNALGRVRRFHDNRQLAPLLVRFLGCGFGEAGW